MIKNLSYILKCTLFSCAIFSNDVIAQDTDLFITEVTLPPVLNSGYSYGFWFTLNNSGNSDAAISRTTFIFSKDSIAPNGVIAGSELSAINGKSIESIGGGLIVPDLADGKYFLHAIADYENVIAETNEGNNDFVVAFEIRKPYTDLLPISLSVPETISTTSFSASLTEETVGYLFSGAYTRKVFISKDTIIDDSDYRSEFVENFNNPVGGTFSTIFDLTFPYTQAGDYYLIYKSDFENEVEESNESNNIIFKKFTYAPPLPETDLVGYFSLESGQTVFKAGDVVPFYLDVINLRSEQAAASITAIYLSPAKNYTKETSQRLLEIPTPAVDGNTRIQLTGKFSLPADLAPGADYYLVFETDDKNTVPEYDEVNNNRGLTIKITEIDLMVTPQAAIVTKNPDGSSNLQVSGKVLNVGRETAGSSMLYIYFAEDSLFKNAFVAGQHFIANVAGTSSASFNLNLFVSNLVGPGNYYLIYTADARNEVREIKEFNNHAFQKITIPSLTNDLYVGEIKSEKSEATKGESVSVQVLYGNSGKSDALASKLSYYLSTDKNLSSNDQLISEQSIGNVTPGSKKQITTTVEIPEISDGHYYLIVKASSGDNSADVNTANNTGYLSKAVKVKSKKNGKRADEISAGEEFEFVAQKSFVTIAPNPATGFINIDLTNVKSEGPIVVEVVDSYGKVVRSEKVSSALNHKIDTDNLAAGIYTVAITSINFSEILKVVLQ